MKNLSNPYFSFIILIAHLTLLSSCGGDDDNDIIDQNLVFLTGKEGTSKTWLLNSQGGFGRGDSYSSTPEPKDCDYDDEYIFFTNGTYQKNHGVMECEDFDNLTGTWEITDSPQYPDERVLSIKINETVFVRFIEVLNKESLQLYQEGYLTDTWDYVPK